MSKIGTAHVEIKPVLNRGALDEICREVESGVAAAVAKGLRLDADVYDLAGLAACVDNDVRYYHETASTAVDGQEHLRALGRRILEQVSACTPNCIE